MTPTGRKPSKPGYQFLSPPPLSMNAWTKKIFNIDYAAIEKRIMKMTEDEIKRMLK